MGASSVDLKALTIGVLPGTGNMGSAIAGHLAKAGLSIIVSSRSAEKAQKIAALIQKDIEGAGAVRGYSNEEAAAVADVIIWSPSGSLDDREALLKSLAKYLENKIIIDVTNVVTLMLDESNWGQTSATLLNQKALGVSAKWTTAFKATFWKLLVNLPDPNNPHHTLVAGDDEEAVAITTAIVEMIPGFKAIKAGGLRNSKLVEALGPWWLIEMDKLNAGENHRSGWRFGI
ncbi:hypothetical protein O6H91_07G026200 [Diphasiastrum complanatum]|uniref:Uncharacterized protein n=1 Tax=Diphasiastrum complanatum TaxID=34168 RepID=A0ACC2D3B4_DIPCM|nr:hypothetical protein O6H91_07G026200 [Diphasiastrum complanatum]